MTIHEKMPTATRLVQRLPARQWLASRALYIPVGLRIAHYSNAAAQSAPISEQPPTPETESDPPKSAYKRFREDLMTAMRTKDTATVNPLKALLTAFNARQKATPTQDPENDSLLAQLIHVQIAKRKDSIASFAQYHRTDLVEKEEHEIAVLERYLGQRGTSDEEIRELVREGVEVLRGEGRGANDPGSMSPARIFRWLNEDGERRARVGAARCDPVWMKRVVMDEIKALSDRPDGIVDDAIRVRSKKEHKPYELPRYQ